MYPIQSSARVEYQFVGSTKQERVDAYKAAADAQGKYITRDTFEKMLAGDGQVFFTTYVGDDVVKIDYTSKGDKELTDEQLEYLRKTYGGRSLSETDKLKLLGELSCFGVISGKQALTDSLCLTFKKRSSPLYEKLKSPSATEIPTFASNLRRADNFEDLANIYAARSDEYSADLEMLMYSPFGDHDALEAARAGLYHSNKMFEILKRLQI